MIRHARGRIADGQYDDPRWATIDPEVIDATPRQRPVSSGRHTGPTPKQRVRMLRNAAIKAAADRGLTQRMLAKAFRLPRSVIQDILAGRQLCGRRRADRDGDS